MRELEFLPSWYHQARRCKRLVVLEIWLLVIIALGLGTWTFLARGNVRGKQQMVTTRQGQLDQTHTEERMLAEQLGLRQELQDREQIIASLGFPVDMTRLLQTLDQVMPKEMSMTDFNCSIEETLKPLGPAVAAATPQQPEFDRRLKVKLVAVAPSDVDLANFLAGLTEVPFLDQVGVTYSHYKSDNGHILREFEVTFSMDMNQRTTS
ncbi:MAG TPA: hypothetical protein VKK61_03770 [Tepidisphaeraceae bacterium]|nr:hypothetical protein [Tepidisphaeraceae bacterium]